MISETSTDYANPYRPRAIRALNAAMRRVGARPSLAPDDLVAAARKAEELEDFGWPPLEEPLRRLVEAIEAEAALSGMGRIITRTRIMGVLRSRLRGAAYLADHPGVPSLDIGPPIVITGLQRTGTTFLHRLLAADPRLRALRSWEAVDPVPPRSGPDRRPRQARVADVSLRYLAPDFFAVHPVDAQAPEEEVVLLDQSLLSTTWEATLRVPSYSAWLEEQDQAPAYATLRRSLQILHHQEAGERWVLKTPHHLEWLDALLDEFPDARIVHTHRAPTETLPSFCSMIAHGRGVMSDHVDPLEIGEEWLRKTGRMVDRALDTRDRRGDEVFLDIDYRELIADPLVQVARIYDHIAMDLPSDVEARIDAQRQASPQHRYGRHVYRAADFGLDDDRIRERFAAERERFGLD